MGSSLVNTNTTQTYLRRSKCANRRAVHALYKVLNPGSYIGVTRTYLRELIYVTSTPYRGFKWGSVPRGEGVGLTASSENSYSEN